MNDSTPSGDVISREDVEHVALLSRLALSGAELDEYGRILNRILAYVGQLNELDTEGVAPTSHPAPLRNVVREDEIRPSLTAEEATANAPEAELDCFKVPPVIQEY